MNDDSVEFDRINAVCDEFEDAWLAGRVPDIVDFIAGWEGAPRVALFRYLLELDLEYAAPACQLSGADGQSTGYRLPHPGNAYHP